MEDNLGFTRDKMDLMVLILFVMDKLSVPVEFELIASLSMVEGAISYFDVFGAFETLRERGHVSSPPGAADSFIIADKGRRSLEALGDRLSHPVKSSALRAVRAYHLETARDATIKVSKRELRNGVVMIRLSLGEGDDQVFALELSSGSRENAAIIEKNFRKRAEKIFEAIVGLLTDEDISKEISNRDE